MFVSELTTQDLAHMMLGDRMPNPRHLKIRMNRESGLYEIRIGTACVGIVSKEKTSKGPTYFTFKAEKSVFPAGKAPADFVTRRMADLRSELIRRIDRDTYLEIYERQAIEQARAERYKKLGIDPTNPNPDGSDFHLMNAVDEQIK